MTTTAELQDIKDRLAYAEATTRFLARWILAARADLGVPRIVCLCGSTRFAEQMNEVGAAETLAGHIVVRPEVVAYDQGNDPQLVAPDVKAALDELHLRKIDLADEVFVVNVGGYVGASTRREIEYATATGKPLRWLEEPSQTGAN